jgi:hypothetical protein
MRRCERQGSGKAVPRPDLSPTPRLRRDPSPAALVRPRLRDDQSKGPTVQGGAGAGYLFFGLPLAYRVTKPFLATSSARSPIQLTNLLSVVDQVVPLTTR